VPSRTARFIDALQKGSDGTVTAWSEGKKVRAVYRRDKHINTFRIAKSVIEQAKFSPEFIAAEVLSKLTAVPKKE